MKFSAQVKLKHSSCIIFFSDILMESRWYCAEHFNYNTDFRWHPKHTRLAFVCIFSWESTPQLLSRVAKFLSSHKISCSSQSGSFLRSSKKGLRMKEILQQAWQSILQKLLALIFSSSEIAEKKQLGILQKNLIFWTS